MSNMSKRTIFFGLLFLVLGSLSGISNDASINTWYTTLNKPTLTPPNWVFPIMWSLLYVCMGIAVAIIVKIPNNYKNKALTFFSISFICNLLWSTLFFTLKSPILALVDILIIDVTLIISMYYFKKLRAAAFYFLVPYLLWTLYATYLNSYIWLYN